MMCLFAINHDVFICNKSAKDKRNTSNKNMDFEHLLNECREGGWEDGVEWDGGKGEQSRRMLFSVKQCHKNFHYTRVG